MNNLSAELQRQKENENSKSQSSGLKEYKLAEGIYFSEIQKSTPPHIASSSHSKTEKYDYVPSENPETLFDDFNEFQKQIDKMIESIEELQEIDGWIDDCDFRETIQENYVHIERAYLYQISIIKTLQKADSTSELLKQNTISLIEEKLELHKQKQIVFLKQILGVLEESSQQAVYTQADQNKQPEQIKGQEKDSTTQDILESGLDGVYL